MFICINVLFVVHFSFAFLLQEPLRVRTHRVCPPNFLFLQIMGDIPSIRTVHDTGTTVQNIWIHTVVNIETILEYIISRRTVYARSSQSYRYIQAYTCYTEMHIQVQVIKCRVSRDGLASTTPPHCQAFISDPLAASPRCWSWGAWIMKSTVCKFEVWQGSLQDVLTCGSFGLSVETLINSQWCNGCTPNSWSGELESNPGAGQIFGQCSLIALALFIWEQFDLWVVSLCNN